MLMTCFVFFLILQTSFNYDFSLYVGTQSRLGWKLQGGHKPHICGSQWFGPEPVDQLLYFANLKQRLCETFVFLPRIRRKHTLLIFLCVFDYVTFS